MIKIIKVYILKLSEKTQGGVGCFEVEKLVMEED